MSDALKYATILVGVLAILFLACGSPQTEPIARILPGSPTQAPQPTYTPYPTYTPFPTPVSLTPIPMPTPTVTYTPTVTPPPTHTPTPTATPAPTPTPTPTMTPTPTPTPGVIDYKELFRNNEQHQSRLFRFKGTVVQVIERARDKYDLRVNVGDVWDDSVVYLSAYKGQRLLEGDVIEFVGESVGLHIYEAISGAAITIPQLRSVSVVRLSESGVPLPTTTPEPWTTYEDSEYGYTIYLAPGWYPNEQTDENLSSFSSEDDQVFVEISSRDIGRSYSLDELAFLVLEFWENVARTQSRVMFEIASLQAHQDGTREYYEFHYRSQLATEYCVQDGIVRVFLSDSYPTKPYGFVVDISICEDSLDIYGEEREASLDSFWPSDLPLPRNTPSPTPIPTETSYPTHTPSPTPIPANTISPTHTPEPGFTPSPTPVVSPETKPSSNLGVTIDNPLPIGESLHFYDGITVAVVDVIEDATKIVLEHDQSFNVPPPKGYQYLLVTIEVNNIGKNPAICFG